MISSQYHTQGAKMTRTLTAGEKQSLGVIIGNDLAKTHGKMKYYSQEQIKASLRRNDYAIDFDCWAYCLFMDHQSFDDYHRSIGEQCDYLSMKESMVASLTQNASDSWPDFDFDLSWLEWPDINLSSIFDFID